MPDNEVNKILGEIRLDVDSLEGDVQKVDNYIAQMVANTKARFGANGAVDLGLAKAMEIDSAKANAFLIKAKADEERTLKLAEAKSRAILEKSAADTERINAKKLNDERLTNARIEAIQQKTNASIQKAAHHHNSLMDRIYSQSRWLISSGMIYGSGTVFADVANNIREVERAVISLQKVMEDADFDFLRDEVMIKNAKEFGFAITEVGEAMKLWAQAGKEQSEVVDLTRTTMLAANVADITAAEAVDYLLSATMQFNIAAQDSIKIIDGLNEVDRLYATTVKDLFQGISKAGSVTKMYGAEIQDLVGWTQVLNEAMRVTGKEAGNAIRTIITRVYSPKLMKDIEDIAKIKIDLGGGQLEKIDNVLRMLADRWKTLSDAEKNQLAVAAGGTHRRNQFIAIMQNYDKALAATATYLNSAGSAAKENERLMESYDKKLQQLKATYQELAVTIGDAGLLDLMKGLADGTKEAIEWFGNLTPETQKLIITVTAITVSMGALNLAFRVFVGTSIRQAIIGTANFAASLGLVNASAITARGAIMTLGTGLAGPLGLVVLAAGAATAGIVHYMNTTAKASAKQKELNSEIAEYNRVSKEGVSKGQIETIRERIKALDDEIKKLNERKAAVEKSIANDTKHGAYSIPKANELKQLNDEIERHNRLRNTMNAAMEKTILLDGQAAMETANKATQTKIETSYTVKLIDEYLSLSKQEKLSQENKQRLIDIAGNLGDKYTFLIKTIGENGRATGLNVQALESHKKALLALSQAEMDNAKVTLQSNLTKTQTVLEQARQRINILLKEQEVLRNAMNDPTLNTGFEYTRNVRALEKNSELLKKEQQEILAANRAIDIYKAGLDGLNNIKIGGNTTTEGSGGSSGGGSSKTAAEKAKKAAQAYVDAIESALRPYQLSVERAANAVSALSIREQILQKQIESGLGTEKTANELLKVRHQLLGDTTKQLSGYTWQQAALHNQAEQERAKLAQLEAQLKKAHDPEVVKTLQQEIDNLNRSIAQAGQQYLQIDLQKLDMINRIKEAEKAAADAVKERQEAEEKRWSDAYQLANDYARHEVNMARWSTEQQIEFYEKLRQSHDWTQQQMWDVEENLFRLRRQQLDNFMDKMEKQYQSQLDEIDSRLKETTDELQRQMDALDRESTENDRESAKQDHLNKLADLQEEYHYHELRTGKDHEKAMADIKKQIDEENRRWQEQQNEWLIDDKKDALQEQIDDAQDAADKERQNLEDHYKQVVEIANNGALDTLAALAATNPKWLKIGQDWIQNLMDGISSKESEFQETVEKATSQMDGYKKQAPSSGSVSPGGAVDKAKKEKAGITLDSGDFSMIGNTAVMWSRELADLLDVSVDWDDKKKKVEIGNKWFTPLRNDNGRTYVGIREVAEALGYQVDWDASKREIDIYKAADGGIFMDPAFIQVAEAGYPEVVLPVQNIQPMINSAVNVAIKPGNDSLIKEIRILTAAVKANGGMKIEKLLNIENANMNSDTSFGTAARQSLLAVKSVMRGRGLGG